VLGSATATPVSSFTPPDSITVTMYRLVYPGGGNTNIACQLNPPDKNWGCTWFDQFRYPSDQVRPYPYTNNPATVSIETDYLLDVVPREMPVDPFHPTAIQAQAIAARSYAYWHIRQGSAINNSNQFQVFVPYTFEALSSTTFPDNPSDPCASSNLNRYQRIVCGAVARRHYIAYGTSPNDDLPAFSEFFADIRNRTVNGGQPYLIAVDDPISSHPDIVPDGHGRGMSQKGAGRWARGNLSFNMNRDLGAWSVRWERAEQILVHYYTGVHIRDAANNNALLTPSYRWNPLQINWDTPDNRPPTMDHGGTYPISVEVQNTGISDWTCGYPNFSHVLTYRWAKAGHGEVTGSSWASVCGTLKGDPSPMVNLTIQNIPNWGAGAYTIRFDIYVTSAYGNFWFSERGWRSYDVSVCVGGPCKGFIPAVRKDYP